MKNNDFNKFPLVQIAAIDEYERGNSETSKNYPSLELVRLEQIFLKINLVTSLNMDLVVVVIQNIC